MPNSEPPSQPTGQRILIVDDNVDIVRVMERILAKEGYDLLTAHDGESALKLARAAAPDLLLLDVMMPKIDGLEVCRQLKADESTSGIMVILVTGRGSLEHLVQGFDAGADDYIPKPFHIPELVARTRSALRIKNLTDDIAERNRQLVRSQSQLVQKEKMATIGLLASGIAHEFNNIMAGISGYAQLAKRDPAYKDMLVDVAMTQAERAFELTKSLSTYHSAAPTVGECRLAEVVEGALCLVAKELRRYAISASTSVPDSLGVAISPGQLQEVLLNLAINAIHAIGPTGGQLTIRAAEIDAEHVSIEVTDDGKGIPSDEVSKIFDPFFTTKGALGGGSQEGTGLGLTVCYNIVQANSGHIEVDSQLGRGTTFRIHLPICCAPHYAEPDEDIVDALAEPCAEPLRILVVDDEVLAHETLQAYLKGHEVICVSVVEEALEAYRQEAFDFVVLDIGTEGNVNGFRAIEEFASFEPQPRVVFASGCFPEAGDRDYIRRAHGHLLKPYKLDDLARLLGLGSISVPSGLASPVPE
jgi:DNA-binding response OmpR family regulator